MLFLLQVIAQAYDNPIPGFQTPTVSNLRLWDALPVTEFDLAAFNAGDYDKVREREQLLILLARCNARGCVFALCVCLEE